MNFVTQPLRASASLLVLLPLTVGWGSCWSTAEAPDLTGVWEVTYDDALGVEIVIEGSTYEFEVGHDGGTVNFQHDGVDLSFHIDCASEAIICPSEVWPERVSFSHDDPIYPSRVHMTIPEQVCSGDMGGAAASSEDCGDETANPDCDDICEGDIVTMERRVFGTIEDNGQRLMLYLGGGFASNGFNCVMAAGSVAEADIFSGGQRMMNDWTGDALENGEIRTGYVGACLWAADNELYEEAQTVVLDASVVLTTGFNAARDQSLDLSQFLDEADDDVAAR